MNVTANSSINNSTAAGVSGPTDSGSHQPLDRVATGADSVSVVGQRVIEKTAENSTPEPINWGLRIISIILVPFIVIAKIFHLAIMGLSYLLGLCCCSCCCKDATYLINPSVLDKK